MTQPHQQQPQPASYQQTLAQAAALLAAAKAGQSPEAVLRQMSQAVIGQRESVAVWTIGQLRALWAKVKPYDGDSVQQFTEQAARVLATAQTSVARTTAAAQVQQLRSVGVNFTVTPTAPLNVRATSARVSGGRVSLVHKSTQVQYEPAAKAGVTVVDNRAQTPKPRVTVTVADTDTQQVLNRPARDYRYQKSQGATDEQAHQAAADRIESIVNDNLMLSQRLAEAEALAKAEDLDNRVIGYRRVIHPEQSRGGSCGMCIAASDRLYKVSELKPIHGGCNCTVAAVTKEFDPADAVNKVDLKQLYGHAQGNTNAELKRTRYQVDEHGELGPVLVPKSKYKPRARPPKERARTASTPTALPHNKTSVST